MVYFPKAYVRVRFSSSNHRPNWNGQNILKISNSPPCSSTTALIPKFKGRSCRFSKETLCDPCSAQNENSWGLTLNPRILPCLALVKVAGLSKEIKVSPLFGLSLSSRENQISSHSAAFYFGQCLALNQAGKMSYRKAVLWERQERSACYVIKGINTTQDRKQWPQKLHGSVWGLQWSHHTPEIINVLNQLA